MIHYLIVPADLAILPFDVSDIPIRAPSQQVPIDCMISDDQIFWRGRNQPIDAMKLVGLV